MIDQILRELDRKLSEACEMSRDYTQPIQETAYQSGRAVGISDAIYAIKKAISVQADGDKKGN